MNPEVTFIIGSGRSGTSILFSCLSGHPDFGWFPNIADKLPGASILAIGSRIWPKSRIFGPAPEANRAFKAAGYDLQDIRRKQGPLELSDLDPKAPQWLREQVSTWCHFQKKQRFISKNTAHGLRIKALLEAFPEARFIHLIRDGRAVVNSLQQVKWWPDLDLWWCEGTPRRLAAAGENPWVIAARHWSLQVEHILAGRELIPEKHYYELRYEDWLEEPDTYFDELSGFLSIDKSDTDFLAHLKTIHLNPQTARRWEQELDAAAVSAIEKEAGDTLKKLGY